MKRWFPATACLAGLLLLGVLVAHAASGQQTGRGPAYSVVAVRDALGRDPGAWIGRAIWVRAIAEPCQVVASPHSPLRCATIEPVLVDPAGTDLAEPLPLVVSGANPLTAAFGNLPLVGPLFMPARAPLWETLRTYRVRLQTRSKDKCGGMPCFEAVLLGVRA